MTLKNRQIGCGCKNRDATLTWLRLLWISSLLVAMLLGSNMPAYGWFQATGGCNDRILKDAKSLFDTGVLEKAKTEAKKLFDRPDPCGSEAKAFYDFVVAVQKNSDLERNARLALRTSNKEQACKFLLEIEASVKALPRLAPYSKGLSSMKTQAGGCQILPKLSEQDQQNFESAQQLLEKGKCDQAQQLLSQIQRNSPEFEDVRPYLQKANDCIQKEREDRTRTLAQNYEDLCGMADRLTEQMNFKAAFEKAAEAQKIQPAEQRASSLKRRIEKAIDAELSALGEGIDLFYAGQYARARAKLESFAQARHSAVALALARFYRAAALGGEFFITGEKNEEIKRAALDQFAQAQKDSVGLVTFRWDGISPRIKDLYDQAVSGNPKAKSK